MSICVLGSINLDLVLRVARLPTPGETLAASSRADRLGGKGANQAAAAARLGATTRLIGAIGDDQVGDRLLAQLGATGVDVVQVRRVAGQSTGQALILVSDAGENVIVVDGGANLALTADQLHAEAWSDVAVLLAQLETPPAVIQAAFAAARSRGVRTLLNAAPALDEGRVLFDLTDVLIVNQTELARFAGAAPGADLDQTARAALGLIAAPGQWVIVTLGAAGALAVTADQRLVVPGRPAAVIDTTGAGDCFCGALAVALSEGQTMGEALHLANVAASLSVGRHGAAGAMPTRPEVEAARAAV